MLAAGAREIPGVVGGEADGCPTSSKTAGCSSRVREVRLENPRKDEKPRRSVLIGSVKTKKRPNESKVLHLKDA